MRRSSMLLVMLAVLVVPVLAFAGCSSSTKTTPTTPTTPKTTPSTGTVTVTMVDFSFQPQTLTIKTGTTVKWVNNGAAPHEPAGTGFDVGPIQPGSSGTHTFTTNGTFPYKCLVHPTVMTGTIIVNSTGTGSGTTTTPTTPSSGSRSVPGY